MKSMPVPKNQESIVKKVVADNYDVEMHKVKKDVVLYFYAPWCGHCKEFDSVFKKVAKKMMKKLSLVAWMELEMTFPICSPHLRDSHPSSSCLPTKSLIPSSTKEIVATNPLKIGSTVILVSS